MRASDFVTPAEHEALQAIARDRAAGLDPFGDDELDGPPGNGAGSGASETGAGAGDGSTDGGADSGTDRGTDSGKAADRKTGETLEPEAEAGTAAKAAEEAAASPETPPALKFRAAVPEDYRAQRTALLTARADALGALMAGEMDAAAFAAIDAQVADALEDLTSQRIRAETLQEVNAQTEQSAQHAAIHQLITQAKPVLDYMGDATASRQFDLALQLLQTDPAKEALPFARLVDEAHQAVLALRGLGGPGAANSAATSAAASVAASVAPATSPAPRKPEGTAPVTLRNLPVASVPAGNGGALEHMGRLSGQAYEEAFAKLSPAQKRALLDD